MTMSLGEVKWSGPPPGMPGVPSVISTLPAGAELDDLLSALVAARRSVGSDRIGHPDVALAIDLDAVGPDEHAASEARHHLPSGLNL